MTVRIVSSICANLRSVSSMRVPGTPRTCSLMRPASTVGKKSRPTSGKSAERRRHEDGERADDEGAALERPRQPAAVEHAQPLESALERREEAPRERRRRRVASVRVVLGLLPQQVVHHRRHERAREEVRGEHREDDRHRERDEERLRGAGDEDDRDEDDADAERRDERRRRDLGGAVEDGPHDGLALRHVAVDVLDLHRRVVDQDADGERHAAERHDVQRLAEPRRAR